MDIEYDSDLSEIEEFEVNLDGGVQPYMHEPERRAAAETDDDSDRDSDSSAFSVVDDQEQNADVSTWCECGNCRVMPQRFTNRCCRNTNVVDGKIEAEGLTCITQHDGYIANCLNRHVLETSFYEFLKYHGPPEEGQPIHKTYRYIAYRRFSRWVYGLLGKGVRKIIPSCATIRIRTEFPSQEYCGFRYPVLPQ